MLDGIPLHIQEIRLDEGRIIIEHKIPGLAGSIAQDLGKRFTRLFLTGMLYGDSALSELEKLNKRFMSGEPVPFEADTVAALEITEVTINALEVREVAGESNHFIYHMYLIENPIFSENQLPKEAAFMEELNSQANLEAIDFLKSALGNLDILDEAKKRIHNLKKFRDELRIENFV